MKKTLLLSVVASTMIMAGGDIAPVQPVVVAPVIPAPVVTGWDFSGQSVVYYQTNDSGTNNLFDKETSKAAVGLQLSAVNKDLFAGVGAGLELSGITHAGLYDDVVKGYMQTAGNGGNSNLSSSAAITQGYLTYAIGNTSVKLGRQTLPKALSPFAFSESWNVFKNSFDAALLVNTDIANTTVVYAWVHDNNHNGIPKLGSKKQGNLGLFTKANGSDGVHMLTVQNKSVENLTLTGTYYYGKGQGSDADINIVWADAKYKMGDYNLAVQGGSVMDDDFTNNTTAYGAKVGATYGMYNGYLAYSHVNDGDSGVFNVGGVKTPLYTQMILNQGAISSDNDTVVAKVGTKVLDGNVALAYGYTTDNSAASNNYQEADLTYSTKVLNDSTKLFAGYIYSKTDSSDAVNTIRVWGRYNF